MTSPLWYQYAAEAGMVPKDDPCVCWGVGPAPGAGPGRSGDVESPTKPQQQCCVPSETAKFLIGATCLRCQATRAEHHYETSLYSFALFLSCT